MEHLVLNLLVVVIAIAAAPIMAHLIPRIKVPVVVIELGLGILIGPQVLQLAEVDLVIDTFAQIGLAFLFFLAGFEIDFGRIRGQPLKLAGLGWLLSIGLAVGAALLLQITGTILLVRYVAIALTTTAIGTLMPILRDARDVETPFGTLVLAAGAVGEFGPILLIALLLSTENSQTTTLLVLMLFGGMVFASLRLAARWQRGALAQLAWRTMHSSAQLPLRLSILVLIILVAVAVLFRLEFLLGAFAAGVIVAQALRDMAHADFEPLLVKYEGVSFGLFVPIFFVVSGMKFDLHALLASPISWLLLPVFLGLFLLVRGLPALLLYRQALGATDRRALALYSSTQLPLLVAISELGVHQGQMRPETAAALVGAGMLSVFLFPLLALSLRRRSPAAPPTVEAAESRSGVEQPA